MSTIIVRVWVDLEIKGAADRKAALEIAHRHPIHVDTNNEAELYDMQVSGQVWEKGGENL